MPLSEEVKRKILVDAGYDPALFHIDEVPHNPVETPVAPAPQPMTGPQAFWTNLKRSAIPGIASLPAMAGGAELGAGIGSILGPIGSGIGGIVGGVGAGVAANMGVSKLQEEVLKRTQGEEAYKKGLEEVAKANQDQRVMSTLGQIAPGFAAFGPGNLMNAGRAITKSLVGVKPLIAESQALTGVGLNTGLAGGVEAGQEYLQGEKLDPVKIGVNAIAGGVLQNKPWGPVGRRLFPNMIEHQPSGDSSGPTDNSKIAGLLPERTGPIITPEPRINPINDPLGKDAGLMEAQLEAAPPNAANKLIDPVKQLPLQSGGPIIAEPSPNKNYTLNDVLNSEQVADHYYSGKPVNAQALSEILRIDTNKARNLMNEWNLPENTDLKPIVPEAQAKVRDVDEGTKYYQPDTTGKSGEVRGLLPEDLEAARELAAKRGQTVRTQDEILGHKDNLPKRGRANLDTREMTLSESRATPDTAPHEGAHQMLDDLRFSKLRGDREFYNQGLKAAGGSEESLAQAAGLRYNEIADKPLSNWVRDFVSNTKRITRLADERDMSNLLARKVRDDRPYSESPEYHGNIRKRGNPLPSVKTNLEGEGSTDNASSSIREQGGDSTHTNTRAKEETQEPSPSFIPKLASVTDKLRRKGPEGAKAADAAEAFERSEREYKGAITNRFHDNTIKLSKDHEQARRYIWESKYKDEEGFTPTAKPSLADKKIIDGELHDTYKHVHDLQRELGYKINGREVKDNPNLRGPQIIDSGVMDILQNGKENNPERVKLLKDYVDHQVKYNTDIKGDTLEAKTIGAKKLLNDYLNGLNAAHGTPEFAALRRAEGFGIPYSWFEKDINRLFQRYGNRVARDLSYFKNVESKPEIAALFGAGGEFHDTISPVVSPDIQVAKRRMTGDYSKKEALYEAIEHAVRGVILGPLTGIKNTIGTMSQLLPYVASRDLPKIVEAFSYIRKGLKDSLELGVNRPNTTDIQVRESSGVSRMVDNLHNWGNIARRVTGANYIEQMTRAHNMALGELLVQSHWGRAAKGDVEAKAFLKKFDPDGGGFRLGATLNEATIKRIAANFTERVQGTYGMRGLPSGLLEPTSPAYYLMSLAKWSVEKSNVIKQDVINPAIKNGDFAPLIRYTLGSLLAGEAVKEIGELFNNKKDRTPNLTELSESGSTADITHKIFELGALAGYGGFVIDAIKLVGDVGMHYRPRGYSTPSIEMVSDITEEAISAANSVAEGSDPLETFFKFGLNTIINTVQAARLVNNQLSSEDKARTDKFRDKEVYDRLVENKKPVNFTNTDRYKDSEERDFKRAKTAEEGKKILEEKILPKYNNLTPEEKKDKLSALKKNSYQVAPADKKERKKFLTWIERTQGVQSSEDLATDKSAQDQENRLKSHLVPRR